MTPPSNNRGAAPPDKELFAERWHSALRAACTDLSWLLGRGYAENSALELVGNRHDLRSRQREAVGRSAASEEEMRRRLAKRVTTDQLNGQPIIIDAFNVLNTIELAIGGGLILLTRDGCARDLGGVHGNWRRATQTRPALEAIGAHLEEAGAAACEWVVDAPVSNSGRLCESIQAVAADHGWDWRPRTVAHADTELVDSTSVVASADRGVLDECQRWSSLALDVVLSRVPGAWRCDLSAPAGAGGWI